MYQKIFTIIRDKLSMSTRSRATEFASRRFWLGIDENNTVAEIYMLTLVEVGECFIMQFNGWRGSCTQNILKGKDLVVGIWRQVGLLLFEDGEGEYIAGEQAKEHSC